MKILCIHSLGDTPAVEAGADSAILRPGEPVFPADIPGGWQSLIVPAVRISRLGTSIRKTKAREYYDSFTLFHVLWPACGDCVAPGIPAAIADRTFSPGKWLPVPEGTAGAETSVRSLSSDSPELASFLIDIPALEIDAAIARLSEYMTFKTGDILLFFNAAHTLGSAELDTEIKAGIDGAEVLSFRIK